MLLLSNVAKNVPIRRLLVSLVVFWNSLVFAPSTLAANPPMDVYALVYSSSAIELFFKPEPGTTTEIIRNNAVLSVTDARSLFQPELDAALSYRYELRSVDADGNRSDAVALEASTANFSLPIRRIDAFPVDVAPTDSVQAEPIIGIESDQSAEGANTETANNLNEGNALVTPAFDDESESSASDVLPPRADSCNVSSVNELRACVRSTANGGSIYIRQNLACSGGDCCSNGQALLDLRGASNVTVLGNGKRLLRHSGHRQCSLLDIANSRDITIDRWHLDDDVAVAPCRVEDRCPKMVHVRSSNNVSFTSSSISHGKGYTVYVNNVDGFAFKNSALIDSGVLGLYVGHNNTPSRNITISNSVFRDNQTNALALLGVVGSTSSNRISNNLFLRNHRKGQWQVSPQYGTGYTGGGQVYIAKANGVVFENNRILDGYCENCHIQSGARTGVGGLEFGLPNQSSVANLSIRNNTISNHDGFGLYANSGTSISASIALEGNQLINNFRGLHNLQTAATGGNSIANTRQFESFEASANPAAGYAVDTCGNASVERVCTSNHTQFGQCRVRLKSSSDSCSVNSAILRGPDIRVQARNVLHASAWISGRSNAEWCFEFLTTSGSIVGSECRSFEDADTSEVRAYVGAPALRSTVPANVSTARLVIRTRGPGAIVELDDLQLSGY